MINNLIFEKSYDGTFDTFNCYYTTPKSEIFLCGNNQDGSFRIGNFMNIKNESLRRKIEQDIELAHTNTLPVEERISKYNKTFKSM